MAFPLEPEDVPSSTRMLEVDLGAEPLKLPPDVLSPLLLPLLLESVAGGDGRPEDEVGLNTGRSGRSGRFEDDAAEPRNIAESGRCLVARAGREVIGMRSSRQS